MKYRVYKEREFINLLKSNGYSLVRHSGGHRIFTNGDGKHISLPLSCNPIIINRLIKENNLEWK